MQICTSLIFRFNMQAILGRFPSNLAFAIALTDIADTQLYGFTTGIYASKLNEHQHYPIDNNIDLCKFLS